MLDPADEKLQGDGLFGIGVRYLLQQTAHGDLDAKFFFKFADKTLLGSFA
jgi:hypothetical protein